jgi:hypothetical protein
MKGTTKQAAPVNPTINPPQVIPIDQINTYAKQLKITFVSGYKGYSTGLYKLYIYTYNKIYDGYMVTTINRKENPLVGYYPKLNNNFTTKLFNIGNTDEQYYDDYNQIMYYLKDNKWYKMDLSVFIKDRIYPTIEVFE